MIHPIRSIQARVQNYYSSHFEHSSAGRHLRTYKDCHKGQACFLIGNGPSLRPEDLSAIQAAGYPTFAFNRIYHIFSETSWRPTYYISQDDKMLVGCREEISALELPHKFIPANLRWYFDIHIPGAEEFYLSTRQGEENWFSDDFSHCVCWTNTVMYTAIQLAAYMGFETIYLIGVDHHFHTSINANGEIVVDPTAKDYFSDQYNKDKDQLYIPNTDKSTLVYVAAKKHCDARGIQVYNATRGGKLEVFPRVNVDEILMKDKL